MKSPGASGPSNWAALPVRIITLDKESIAKERFTALNFTDVREEIERTADLSRKTPDQLYSDSLITNMARLMLQDGQRRSFELPNAGAVGCFISHLAICSMEDVTLVVEEDAIPQAHLITQLAAALNLADREGDALDIVIFGPIQSFQGMQPWVPPVIALRQVR